MSKLVQCQDGMALKDGIVLYRMAKPVARYITELERRIAELEQPWVSVGERLPEKHTTVLVEGGIAQWRGDCPVTGGWWSLTGIEYPGKPIQWEVTCWMPLPTPPEEQS